MLAANLLVVVLLVGLTFACQSDAAKENATQDTATSPGSSPSPEATADLARTATPESAPATATTGQATQDAAVVPSPVPTPDAGRTVVVPSSSGRVMITGIFTAAIGDPPGGAGQPRQSAALTEASGKRWRLVFDAAVFRAPGGVLEWSSKRVTLEGTPTGEPDTILVTSMVLAP